MTKTIVKEQVEKDWFNTAFDELNVVWNVSYELDDLAKAFYNTGNSYVATQLSDCAKVIKEAQAKIRTAIGQSINERCIASQQATVNMLNAVFAGATLKEREVNNGKTEM